MWNALSVLLTSLMLVAMQAHAVPCNDGQAPVPEHGSGECKACACVASGCCFSQIPADTSLFPLTAIPAQLKDHAPAVAEIAWHALDWEPPRLPSPVGLSPDPVPAAPVPIYIRDCAYLN